MWLTTMTAAEAMLSPVENGFGLSFLTWLALGSLAYWATLYLLVRTFRAESYGYWFLFLVAFLPPMLLATLLLLEEEPISIGIINLTISRFALIASIGHMITTVWVNRHIWGMSNWLIAGGFAYFTFLIWRMALLSELTIGIEMYFIVPNLAMAAMIFGLTQEVINCYMKEGGKTNGS